MKRLVLTIAVSLLRLAYVPFRPLSVRPRITIISRQSDQPTDDIRMLSAYLRKQYPRTECRVLSKLIGGGLTGKLSYALHLPVQMYYIATSSVIVLDGYCIAACVLKHKSGTRVIQMWHASAAVKKFGYQTIGRQSGHSRLTADIMCMHRGYDVILSPSEETGRIFAEAFNAETDRLRYMGLPRLDLISHPRKDREQARLALGIPEEKEILLYAPTFRKGEPIPLEEMLAAIDPDRFAVAVCLHPLDDMTKVPGQISGLQMIQTPPGWTSYDWMGICDRMITDYSALSVEFSLTGRPLYFYIYDIDRYSVSTGLNIDPGEEMPGASAGTAEELAQVLCRPYDTDALQRFRNKYITVDTDACTARLGDYIHGIAEKIH